MQRFRGGLVFKAHRLCVSLKPRIERNKEEKRGDGVALLSHSLRINPQSRAPKLIAQKVYIISLEKVDSST